VREELSCIPRGTFGARPVSLISIQDRALRAFPWLPFLRASGAVKCAAVVDCRAIVSQSPAIVHGFVMRAALCRALSFI